MTIAKNDVFIGGIKNLVRGFFQVGGMSKFLAGGGGLSPHPSPLGKTLRANGILAKLRYYVTADILKTIHYALFDSHMR